MSEPCDRKRCRGHLETWAEELRGDGTTWRYLVCDLDARHVVERDTGPTAGLAQDSLFSDGGDT